MTRTDRMAVLLGCLWGAPAAWVSASALSAVSCQTVPTRTVVEPPKAPRHPDGVLLEPEALAPPRAVESAPAGGVVSLREPLDEPAVDAAVEAFFAVFTSHDAEGLDEVLSKAARLLDSHGGSSYSIVHEELLRRVSAFKASNVGAMRFEVRDRSEYGDLGETGPRRRPGEMRPGDILVRVHVSLPRVSGDRLFGDLVTLLLRTEDDAEEAGPARLRVVGFDEQAVP